MLAADSAVVPVAVVAPAEVVGYFADCLVEAAVGIVAELEVVAAGCFAGLLVAGVAEVAEVAAEHSVADFAAAAELVPDSL